MHESHVSDVRMPSDLPQSYIIPIKASSAYALWVTTDDAVNSAYVSSPFYYCNSSSYKAKSPEQNVRYCMIRKCL